MKAIFITYNQAFNEEIVEVLENCGQRGFSRWTEIQGRGSTTGEPHLGNHAWPTLNHAIISMVEDEKVANIMSEVEKKAVQSSELGLRAFVLPVESFY